MTYFFEVLLKKNGLNSRDLLVNDFVVQRRKEKGEATNALPLAGFGVAKPQVFDTKMHKITWQQLIVLIPKTQPAATDLKLD